MPLILISIFWCGLEENELLQSCNSPGVGDCLACGMVKHTSVLFYSEVCVAKDVFHVTVKYQLQLKALVYFMVHLPLAEMGDRLVF